MDETAAKIVDLLEKAANQVGHTSEQAFPYLVHMTYVKGWVGLGMSCVFGIAAAVAFSFVVRHCRRTDPSIGEGPIVVAAISILIFSLSLTGIHGSLPSILEPTGVTIQHLIEELRHR